MLARMSDRPHGPRKQPRQARSRALVDAVVEATEKVLAEEGADSLTTTRVAEVAGVSVGSLYQYYPSKESLIAAVIERRIEDDVRWMDTVLPQLAGQPLRVIVRQCLERTVAVFRAETALYRAILTSMEDVARHDVVAGMVAEGTRRFAEMLGRMPIAPGSAERAAWIVVTALVAVVRTAARERPALLDDPALIDDLERMTVRYLLPDDAG
jgi:AcrR family transcriptional regulator